MHIEKKIEDRGREESDRIEEARKKQIAKAGIESPEEKKQREEMERMKDATIQRVKERID